tara:strand:- start:732 stop:1739 length:1008 start_codon:yes stop_codon:yes gene_type:complete
LFSKYFGRLFIASLLTISFVIALTACANGDVVSVVPTTQPSSVQSAEIKTELEKLTLTATTSIVADWVQQVGGERVVVETIVPPGVDAHSYQVTPEGVKKISDSDFVFGIGVQYEDKWLVKLLENYPDDRVTFLGDLIDPIRFKDEHQEDEEHDEHEGHGHGQFDPHVWFDPIRVASIASIIGAELKLMDPEGTQYYDDRVKVYVSDLYTLNSNIMSEVEQIPIHDRVILTSHESLGYLEARYGFRVLTAVLPGLDGDIASTPKDLVHAIEAIEENDVTVIFTDETRSAKAVDRVAEETGIEVVSGLKVESLKNGQTYIEFMETNINIILFHLKK